MAGGAACALCPGSSDQSGQQRSLWRDCSSFSSMKSCTLCLCQHAEHHAKSPISDSETAEFTLLGGTWYLVSLKHHLTGCEQGTMLFNIAAQSQAASSV